MRNLIIVTTLLLLLAACSKGDLEAAALKFGLSLAKGACQDSANCSVQCGAGQRLNMRDLTCRDTPG